MSSWTRQQYEELSRDVAERLKPKGYYTGNMMGGQTRQAPQKQIWLIDDYKTIMELCIEHGVDIAHHRSRKFCYLIGHADVDVDLVHYADHGNEASLADRALRLLALKSIRLPSLEHA